MGKIAMAVVWRQDGEDLCDGIQASEWDRLAWFGFLCVRSICAHSWSILMSRIDRASVTRSIILLNHAPGRSNIQILMNNSSSRIHEILRRTLPPHKDPHALREAPLQTLCLDVWRRKEVPQTLR